MLGAEPWISPTWWDSDRSSVRFQCDATCWIDCSRVARPNESAGRVVFLYRGAVTARDNHEASRQSPAAVPGPARHRNLLDDQVPFLSIAIDDLGTQHESLAPKPTIQTSRPKR